MRSFSVPYYIIFSNKSSIARKYNKKDRAKSEMALSMLLWEVEDQVLFFRKFVVNKIQFRITEPVKKY